MRNRGLSESRAIPWPCLVFLFDDVCGFAWDGSQLCVANYSYKQYIGKAYRLDIAKTSHGDTPAVTGLVDCGGNSVDTGPMPC